MKGGGKAKARATFLIDADQHGLTGGAPDGVGERAQSVEIFVVARIDGHAGQARLEQGGEFVGQFRSVEAEEQSLENLRAWALSQGVDSGCNRVFLACSSAFRKVLSCALRAIRSYIGEESKVANRSTSADAD